MQTAIQKVVDGDHLSRQEAFNAMEVIMQGAATPAQIGAFLIALRMKGEQPQEIAGFASSMRKNANAVLSKHSHEAVDLVGTGGDGKHTFNISTVASFVVAGADVPVAKHGNRSVSSKCGSADVLSELGINIDLDHRQLARCLDDIGMAFLFAPRLHPAMKYAIGPRREIGVRSVFNILGPISNPAGVRRQLIGVYDRKLLRLLADVLAHLDAEHVLLVHSTDGLDEISLAADTYAVEVDHGEVRERVLKPEDFGLKRSQAHIGGGDPAENAALATGVLQGQAGPERDIVIANAAAGIYVAGRTRSLSEAAEMARTSIDSGAAITKLEALRRLSHQL